MLTLAHIDNQCEDMVIDLLCILAGQLWIPVIQAIVGPEF